MNNNNNNNIYTALNTGVSKCLNLKLQKRWVFKRDLNESVEVAWRIWRGRLFRNDGAATAKARWPSIASVSTWDHSQVEIVNCMTIVNWRNAMELLKKLDSEDIQVHGH